MDSQNWESALARFHAFGAAPSVARYLDLFSPDGTVQHPGMAEPLRGSAIGEFVAAALEAVPDFTMTPVHWCAHDDTVFVEARNTGTIAGRPAVWPSIYRLITKEGRILNGRAFYDRAAALSHVDTDLADRRDEPHTTVLDGAVTDPSNDTARHIHYPRIITEFLQPYADAWSAPQPERFAPFYLPHGTMIDPRMHHPIKQPAITTHYRKLLSDFTDLRLVLQSWAYRPGMLFAEWTATATIDHQPVQIARADRFSLDDTRIEQRVGYVDSLSIATAENARFANGTVFTTR